MIERRPISLKNANLMAHQDNGTTVHEDGSNTVTLHMRDAAREYTHTVKGDKAVSIERAMEDHALAHQSGDQEQINKTDKKLPRRLQAHQ